MIIPEVKRVIDLTVGEFRQILREELLQLLNLKGEFRNELQIKTVPIEKLSELTGWSTSAIYKKCSKRILPHTKAGKELRFDINEINDWINKKKRKTGDEIVVEFEARQKKILKKVK